MTTDVISILTSDFHKNHQGRVYSLDGVLSMFEKYTAIGGKYFIADNVIIVYQDNSGVCEFHCFSGGSGKDLTDAINTFLSTMRVEYGRAVTYYDNPRVNDISRYCIFPTTIRKIDDGEDRMYEMVFVLGEPDGCGK